MAQKKVMDESMILRDAVVEAMLEKKGENVVSLDLSSIDGAICRYFVICSAQSTTQVDAIADNIEDYVRKTLKEKPRRTDGYDNSVWIVLDYVDVIAHVFQTETRDFYKVEELWADAKREDFTDEPIQKVVKKSTIKAKTATPKVATKKVTSSKTTSKSKVGKSAASKEAPTAKTAKAKKPTTKTVAKKTSTAKSATKSTSKKTSVTKKSTAKTTTKTKAVVAKSKK